ncbi:hypothetical protein TDB9533_01490 [Thalassocella blandensis]|nr:hypothetical protein TDB9533_01490 [Thalassocella blandensis]
MKLTLKIIAAIAAILILIPVLLFIFLDPNMFKPVIEKQADKQGIYLDMKELSWTLWPEFGVKAENITASPRADKNKPIATLDSASFLIQVKPLFRKEFFIDHVSIDNAKINLIVDQSGEGNWQSILDTMQSNSSPANEEAPKSQREEKNQASDSAIDLDINQLTFTNSQFNYDNQQTKQNILIENLTVKLFDVNLDGNPMPMQFQALSTLTNKAGQNAVLKINTSLNQIITLSQDFNTASLQDGVLLVSVYEGDSQKYENIQLHYAMQVDNLNTNLSYKGKISVDELNARKILRNLGTELDTASPSALSQVALSADFNGDSNRVAVNPLKIQVDQTNISGYANITDFTSSRFQVDLKGDQINLDHYLPESKEDDTPETQTDETDTEIPAELLRGISGVASFQFNKATFMDISFQDTVFSMKADKGLMNFDKIETTAFDGRIHADAVVDARNEKTAINFSSKVSNFSLEPFFSYLAISEKFNFTGLVNLTATGNTKGKTTSQLTDSLLLDAKVQGDEVRFFPLNLEEQFCKLVDLINQNEKSSEPKTWQNFSQMQALLANIHFENNKISINTLNAGIANLLLASDGSLNLGGDSYKINLPLKLQESTEAKGKTGSFKTSQNGCAIQSNYWVTRGLTLMECKGAISTLNPIKDCRPDESALKKLVKDYAEFKIKEKHGDDIKQLEQKADKKKEALKDDIDEKLKEKVDEKKIEEKLKNLFGKKKE